MPKPKTKFARGFKKPTLEVSEAAIGQIISEDDKPWLDAKCDSFQPIPDPVCDIDWLAQYKERGQTFDEFMEENPWSDGDKVNGYGKSFVPNGSTLPGRYPDGKIYIVEIGDFEDIAPDCQVLADFASKYLGLPCEILDKFKVEEQDKVLTLTTSNHLENQTKRRRTSQRKTHFKLRHRREGQKVQLHCPFLLGKLQHLIPENGICLIGLTMFDLYEADADLFVAGLADGNARVALFSFARYDPAISFSEEFWYKMKVRKNCLSIGNRKAKILERSCKLLVHELGHLLGLAHCIFFECCMNGSGHLEEDFRQPIFLCPVCLHKLKTLCEFDIRKRYGLLQEFFASFGMLDCEQWVSKRLLISN